jgi:acyl-coenzyme A thioesterase PaaI-like protein
MLREGIETGVPFNVHNDVRVGAIDYGRGEASLPDAPHLRNHLGTVHGAALFAVGEAAAGAALLSTFAKHLGRLRLNAQAADITYLSWARGVITARSVLSADVEHLLGQLRERGRAELRVEAALFDDDDAKVAEMTFRFHLRWSDRIAAEQA